MGGGVATVVGVHPTRRCAPLHGFLHAGFGEGFGDCRGAAVSQNVFLYGSLGASSGEKLCFFFGYVFRECKLVNL